MAEIPFQKGVSGHDKHEEESSFPLNSAKEDESQFVCRLPLRPPPPAHACTHLWNILQSVWRGAAAIKEN